MFFSPVSCYLESVAPLAAQNHVGKALDKLFGLPDNHIHASHPYQAERADSTNRIRSDPAKHERYAHLTFVQPISVGVMIEEDLQGKRPLFQQSAHHTESLIQNSHQRVSRIRRT